MKDGKWKDKKKYMRHLNIEKGEPNGPAGTGRILLNRRHFWDKHLVWVGNGRERKRRPKNFEKRQQAAKYPQKCV